MEWPDFQPVLILCFELGIIVVLSYPCLLTDQSEADRHGAYEDQFCYSE